MRTCQLMQLMKIQLQIQQGQDFQRLTFATALRQQVFAQLAISTEQHRLITEKK